MVYIIINTEMLVYIVYQRKYLTASSWDVRKPTTHFDARDHTSVFDGRTKDKHKKFSTPGYDRDHCFTASLKFSL